jgi:hypothetical protein
MDKPASNIPACDSLLYELEHELETKGITLIDYAKEVAKNCEDIHLLPLPVEMRKSLKLPDVIQLDVKGITNRIFYTTNHYNGAEVRKTPEDFEFPKVPENEKPTLLLAESESQ